MQLCEYGCGREAKHQLKNGKWCCSKSYNSCPVARRKNSESNMGDKNHFYGKHHTSKSKDKYSKKIKKIYRDPDSKYNSPLYKEYRSKLMKDLWNDPNSIFNSISYRKKLSSGVKESWIILNNKLDSIKVTIEKINKNYPFFAKIEEMRYNPDKPGEKEIQVHCKNNECENSKEKDGWFTPTRSEISQRLGALEKPKGFGESNFYCSQHCKDTCFLYGLQGDPFRDNTKPYTSAELEIFNNLVLKRDNKLCYYCSEHTAIIVHHLRPQKLEPFFALDPDYAVSVCKKCHYKHGHPTGSKHSTGNLAKIVCSVESQKFLNQTLEDI